MRHETPEDVLRACIEKLGGMKRVGVDMRPELEERPDTAGRWLSDCLNEEKREKLSLGQAVYLLRRARDAGFHDGMTAWNGLIGYGPASPLAPESEAAELQRRFIDSVQQQERLFAQMKAAGINTDALA